MANALDPRTFVVKSAPPVFNIETDKDDWKVWRLAWDHYLVHSGISKLNTTDADAATQATLTEAKTKTTLGALMSAMAWPTLRVLQNLDMTDAERNNPTDVLTKLDQHIEGDTNYRVYRQMFYARRRHAGEPFDDYLVALRNIGQKCNFVAPPTMTVLEDRIVDMVITGVEDQEVTEKLLQLANNTTYANATQQARTILAAKRDAPKVTTASAAAARVHTPKPNPAAQSQTNHRTPPTKCPKCGFTKHRNATCPALRATCRHCSQVGHYDRCCPTYPNAGPCKRNPPATV